MRDLLDRALDLGEELVDGVRRGAAALERIAVAQERQAGTARASKPRRPAPPRPAPVSEFDAERAKKIAKASGFKVSDEGA